MFVIKQFNKQDMDYTAWACKSFSVIRNDSRTSIRMVPLTPESGPEEMIEICGPTYIENAVGKTIDRFEAQQYPAPPETKRVPRGVKF